ncbi:hypothetical protein L0F63_001453 [Massospora cicadina]|nr:hypothetical protein L0F63_001453 [Massospora cicadina]
MGSGIAQVAAQANYKVVMVDQSEEALNKGHGIIRGSLERIAKKKFSDSTSEQDAFIRSVCSNYSTSSDAVESVKDSDLVIEAIVENIQVKQKLFSLIDKVAPAKTIFCSNTSSLPISEIASSTTRKDRFAGLHFFNPVPQMKLVEVIKIAETSEGVQKALIDFSKKDWEVSHFLQRYAWAVRLFERGDASIEDIDTE